MKEGGGGRDGWRRGGREGYRGRAKEGRDRGRKLGMTSKLIPHPPEQIVELQVQFHYQLHEGGREGGRAEQRGVRQKNLYNYVSNMLTFHSSVGHGSHSVVECLH